MTRKEAIEFGNMWLEMNEYCKDSSTYAFYQMAIKALEQEPVVKGKWIKHEWAEECEGGLISNFECDKCQNWVREDFDFCPNCGADMREVKDDKRRSN